MLRRRAGRRVLAHADGDAVAGRVPRRAVRGADRPRVRREAAVTSSPWRDQRRDVAGRPLHRVRVGRVPEQSSGCSTGRAARGRQAHHARLVQDAAVWAPTRTPGRHRRNRLFTIDLDTNAVTEAPTTRPALPKRSAVLTRRQVADLRRSDDRQNARSTVRAWRPGGVQPDRQPFTETRGTLTPDGRKLVFLSDRTDGVNHLFRRVRREARRGSGRPARQGAAEKAQARRRDAKDQPHRVPGGPRGHPPPRRAADERNGAPAASSLGRRQSSSTSRAPTDKGRGCLHHHRRQGRKAGLDGAVRGPGADADRKEGSLRQDGEGVPDGARRREKKSRVEFALSVKVDKRAEWAQMFDECWRVMKLPPSMTSACRRRLGAMKARYEPLLTYVGENAGPLRHRQRDDRRAERVRTSA